MGAAVRCLRVSASACAIGSRHLPTLSLPHSSPIQLGTPARPRLEAKTALGGISARASALGPAFLLPVHHDSTGYSELLHTELEGRSVHSQPSRRSVGSRQNAPGLLEDGHDMSAFGGGQGLVHARIPADPEPAHIVALLKE